MSDERRGAIGSADQQFDRQIDRLVDGELNAAERRQLLAECEEREGAWRRCALAFLEAQSWRAELTALATPLAAAAPTSANSPVVAIKPTSESSTRRRRWVRTRSHSEQRLATIASGPWALAACALIAFGLGWLARPHDASQNWPGDPEFYASAPPAEPTAPESDAIAESDTYNTSNEFAADPPQTVTLVMDCGPDGEQRQIELPVLPAGGDDLALLEQGEPLVSAELQAALLRMGHRVNERRQLVPLVLEDGRRLVVPVDEIEFTPIETSEYQ
jgi:hypothetical protein